MPTRFSLGITLLLAATAVQAEQTGAFDAAAAFGARPGVSGLSLSPDGQRVAYLSASRGQGSVLVVQGLEKGSIPKAITQADGKPDRLGSCSWVANDRLVCRVYGVTRTADGILPWSRLIAVDADGTNIKLLSTQQNEYSRGWQLNGGWILDWLPDESGSVLMTRNYVPNDHIGSHLGSSDEGLGVDRIDTRKLSISQVEHPNRSATDYITDGRGHVRIMGVRESRAGYDTGMVYYSYRVPGSREWQHLCDFNAVDREGFDPLAVDYDLNLVYGLRKKDGRRALYSISLDGSLHEELVYSRPDVDVDSLVQIGRRQRVVGVSYATAYRHSEYFSSDVKQMLDSLSRALPGAALRVADSSTDESKMLIFSGSDSDPGVYYIFDRKARQLNTFLVVRGSLEGVKLANVKPITYPADDGTMIPGYLTLPPGHEDAKGLPAIVLPHGGPSARDEWGFDWLSQFFANRGFAVLQPNFRGSSGYGDAWFQQNGFRSWQLAIGDVLAAGHWLVKQGIADPAKLGILGWSYGGYAALQSAVVDPNTFKAVIAIAPVTDLPALKEEARNFTNFNLVSHFVGDGPQVHEGSPIEHTDQIKAPVLMFHGAMDRNVSIDESRHMAARLKTSGARVELVTWDNLDHYLEDAEARTQMLRKSEAFLRQAFGM